MNDASTSLTRKRPRRSCVTNNNNKPDDDDDATHSLQELLRHGCRVIIFSGAGLSVAAGLPTFQGHLYQQAARKFRLSDGARVFHYRFLQQRPAEYWQFFAQTLYPSMTKRTMTAATTASHKALCTMEQTGQLIRQYTLNVDGLAAKCGMSIWKGGGNEPKNHGSTDRKDDSLDKKEEATTTTTAVSSAGNHPFSAGKTVELHGNIHELVCRNCATVFPVKSLAQIQLAARNGLPPCPACPDGCLRFRVLLYGDEEGHLIYPINNNNNTANNHGHSPLDELLPNDLQHCQAILWIGISFAQRASCQYFETVYQMRQKAQAKKVHPKQGEEEEEEDDNVVPMFIISPQPVEALENLMDGLQMRLGPERGCRVFTVSSTSDAIFGEFCRDE